MGTIPATSLGGAPTSSGATEIDSCTTISTPGEYVLTKNIRNSPADACIVVAATHVTLDGQGHTIDSDGEGRSIGVTDAESISITDLRIENVRLSDWTQGIELRRAENVTVVSSRFSGVNEAADLTAVSNLRFVDNVVDHRSRDGIQLYSLTDLESRNNTIANNTFQRIGGTAISARSDGLLISNNDIRGGIRGISVLGSNVTIADNLVTKVAGQPKDGFVSFNIGINVDADRTVVENNTLTKNEDFAIRVSGGDAVRLVNNQISKTRDSNTSEDSSVTDGTGVGIAFDAENTTLVGNEISQSDRGVEIIGIEDVTIENNRIERTNEGIVVRRGFMVGDLGGPVAVRDNHIAENVVGVHFESGFPVATAVVEGNTIQENDCFGVLNDNSSVVDARGNYWGAANGPSSSGDPAAPIADPVTGTLANGDGDAVSENPSMPGESNVRFDSWLENATVAAAGA
ncbi:right-handed parallel beta-helix repeat-containing protein [Haladaptatus sp. NG-SE-30]